MSNAVERTDIELFWYPCLYCESECFHKIITEHGGISIGFIFMKKPLYSTQKANHIVCNECDRISGNLSDKDLRVLEMNYIPKSIHQMYPEVARFYSVEMLEVMREKLKDNPTALKTALIAIKAYRLEL